MIPYSDVLSKDVSYIDVDANRWTLSLRVAESLNDDTTGLGWRHLQDKYIQEIRRRDANKSVKLEGPFGEYESTNGLLNLLAVVLTSKLYPLVYRCMLTKISPTIIIRRVEH